MQVSYYSQLTLFNVMILHNDPAILALVKLISTLLIC